MSDEKVARIVAFAIAVPGSISVTATIDLSRDRSVVLDSNRKLISVAREVIYALADNRDFLGYQLALAEGQIDQEQFDEIANRYLASSPNKDDTGLVEKVAILAAIAPDKFDSDFVSVALRCDIDNATRAIQGAKIKHLAQLPDDRARVTSGNKES